MADLLIRAKALNLNRQSLKNYQTMDALYRQTLALQPDNVGAQLGLATSLSNQAYNFASVLKLDRVGKIALAKQGADLAEKAKQTEPNDPAVYRAIATFASLGGDLNGALLADRRWVELDPKNSRAYNNLGLDFSVG